MDGDCGNKIKRNPLLERRAMMKLNEILKSKDITIATTIIHFQQCFPTLPCGCQSWSIRKPKQRKIDSFQFEMLEEIIENTVKNK